MDVQFPCRPTAKGNSPPARGLPDRARSCDCGPDQMLDGDGLCVTCGYWSAETINETWRVQAYRTLEHVA